MAQTGWTQEKISGYGSYSIYVPPGANSSTQVYVFSCNPHDYGNGWLSYVKQKQAENPNAIFVVIPSIQDGSERNNVTNYITDQILSVTNEYNIPSSNINMFSWSNGNKGASAIAYNLNQRGMTIGKYVTFAGIFTEGSIKDFTSTYQTGKSSTGPYIFVTDHSTNSDILKNTCSDYIVVEVSNSNNHSFWTADNENNLIDFLFFGEDPAKNLKITRYVNGVPQQLTYEEFMKIVNTNTVTALYEQYKDDFKAFSSNFTGQGDTLGSNLAYVYNSMSDVEAMIQPSSDINHTAGTGESSIISAMYAASNYYGSVTNKLYENLSDETTAIRAIAEAIFKLDGAASEIAETSLTDGIKTLYSTSNPSIASELENLKSATGKLLENASAAVTGRYNEIENLIGKDVEIGGVGKISKGMLDSAINDIVPALNKEVEVANGVKSSIDSFLGGIGGSSSLLQGGVWEDVKTNLETYKYLLDHNIAASEFIEESIKTAMGLIYDYLGEDSELDDSKLPELRDELSAAEKKLSDLEEQKRQMVASQHQVCDTDGNGNATNCRLEPSDAEIAAVQASIDEAKENVEKLKKEVKRLEDLAAVINAAQDIIMDAIDQVKQSYENPVSSTENNSPFTANFELKLDDYHLEDYGLDPNKNYAKLIDDRYEEMNPKPADSGMSLEEILAQPDPNTPAGNNNNNNYNGGGYPSGDTGVPSQPSVTVTPTPTPTETAPTQTTPTETTPTETTPTETTPTETTPTQTTPTETAPTETTPITPTQTVTPSPTPTETITPTPTPGPSETTTPTPAETKPSEVVKTGGGGVSKKPAPNTDPLTKPTDAVVDEPVIEEPIIEEPVIDEPIIDDFSEPIIEEPIVEEVIPTEEPATPQKDNSTKVLGIAAGVGLAVGAAALGAHTIMKSKDDDEDDNGDYGYED